MTFAVDWEVRTASSQTSKFMISILHHSAHTYLVINIHYMQSHFSPYLTGMRQLETSLGTVRDYFATKINDINTTSTLQSHFENISHDSRDSRATVRRHS